MKILYILTTFVFYWTINSVNAADFYPNTLNQCEPTIPAYNNYEPISFEPTNNLLRKTGENPVFCGEKVIITGKVVDESCVPIPDAKLYLWQVGCDGKYPYRPLRNIADHAFLNLDGRSTFTGSGTATSDNLGRFYFITIAPSHVPDSSVAYLNIRIEHPTLGTVQTKLYLLNHHIISPISDKNVHPALVNSTDRIYDYKLVLSGKSIQKY